MESWVNLNKIIYLPGNGVNILEVKFSEGCSVFDNVTLPKSSRYTILSELYINNVYAH